MPESAALDGPVALVARDRAALLFGAALASAIGVAACNAGPPAPAYGGPPPPPDTVTRVTVTDAAPTPPVMVAAYGAPMVMTDASVPTPPPSVDAGAPKKK